MKFIRVEKSKFEEDDFFLDEFDLEFFLKYIVLIYFILDIIECVVEYFEEEFSIILLDILYFRFVEKFCKYVED